MNLKFLDKGTNLFIHTVISNNVSEKEYKASFYELINDMSFFADSSELFLNFDKLEDGTYLKISFFRNDDMYIFEGMPKNTLIKNGAYLTQINQISAIEKTSRRTTPRHEITIAANLYLPSAYSMINGRPEITGNASFSIQTFDLSAEGICLVSNQHVKLEPKIPYLIEFTVKPDKFLLPAHLVRSGDNPQSRQFKYDYGFVFDFTDSPEEKNRLTLSLFNYMLAAFNR